MLKPSAFILALFAMFSTSVLAQDLRVCPNVQVGVCDGRAPAIYSDCTLGRRWQVQFHIYMRFFRSVCDSDGVCLRP